MKIKSRALLIDLIIKRKYDIVVEIYKGESLDFKRVESLMYFDYLYLYKENVCNLCIDLRKLRKYSVLKDNKIFLYIDKGYSIIKRKGKKKNE